MNKFFALLFALPKSLYVNFKCFDLKTACRLPIIVSHRVRVKGIKKGSIVLNTKEINTGMIRLGISDGAYGKGRNAKSELTCSQNSRITFEGTAHIANNFVINMCPDGELGLGDNFSSNYDLTISCSKHIEFGDDCLLGWHCTFIDGDGHPVFDEAGNIINEDREIIVGNHVWIAAEVACLKGAKIADDCVIGFGSIVSKEFQEKNCMLVGTPTKKVKEKINWKH